MQYKFYQGIADKYLNSSIMQHSRHKESNYSKHIGHYDSIIWIHILRSDSLDACIRGGLYYSADCRAIANGFHPTTHKVNLQASKAIILPKTKGSCHSHHLGHWPFRFSGCDPYLNQYLNIYTTRHHEVSARDSWNYAYHIQFSCLSYHNHHFHLIHSILISPNHHVQFHTITHTKHTNSRAYIFQEFMHFQVIQPTHR